MKSQTKVIAAILFVSIHTFVIGQVFIGEGSSDPDPSAILELKSTSQGFLIPRVNKSNIDNPGEGLLVFDETWHKFFFYEGVRWSGIGTDDDWVIKHDGRIASPKNTKIGIGTSNPGAALEVAGNIWQSGYGNSLYLGIWADNAYGFNDNKNTCIGFRAGELILSSATFNTYIGYQAGLIGDLYDYNTAIGESSQAEPTGSNNTSIGFVSMIYPIDKNCAAGASASSDNASYCNAIGYETDVDDLSNTSVFGYQATGTANNQVRFGNSSVSSIGGSCDWTTIVDESILVDVKDNIPGLEFIKRLRGVKYILDRKSIITHLQSFNPKIKTIPHEKIFTDHQNTPNLGFIAQEVAEVANEIGFSFSGIDPPKNEDDFYCLRYSEFVVPLVKSVQEQQEMINDLQLRLDQQKEEIEDIINSLSEIYNQ